MADEKKTPQEQTFLSDIGSKATIVRHDLETQVADASNRKLTDIGKGLNPLPDSARYIGSFAVHVYQTDIIKQLYFVKQNLQLSMEEVVASKAFEDLRGDIMESFERKRQTRRSGF